jgi:hypothetical protein
MSPVSGPARGKCLFIKGAGRIDENDCLSFTEKHPFCQFFPLKSAPARTSVGAFGKFREMRERWKASCADMADKGKTWRDRGRHWAAPGWQRSGFPLRVSPHVLRGERWLCYRAARPSRKREERPCGRTLSGLILVHLAVQGLAADSQGIGGLAAVAVEKAEDLHDMLFLHGLHGDACL